MPGNERTPEQIQAGYEKEWRAKVGDNRFESIIDSIVEMAGEVLDRDRDFGDAVHTGVVSEGELQWGDIPRLQLDQAESLARHIRLRQGGREDGCGHADAPAMNAG